jgi:hypothetical protein
MAPDRPDDYDDPPRLTLGQRLLTVLPSLERHGGRTQSPRKPPVPADGDADSHPPPSGSASTDPEPDSAASQGSSPSARATRAASRPRAETGRRPDPTDDMSNEELTQAIKRLDDRERRYALYAGPLGAVLGIVLTVLAAHSNPPLHHKNHEALSIIVTYGIVRVVLGGVVSLTALTRRRSVVGFALLFLGTAESFPFALIFWALGGWMIWRVFRCQKVLSSRGVGPQRGRAATTPRAAARSGASDARERVRTRREARERRRGRQPVPAGPPASKRYTPKKPARPRPPAAS